MRIVPFALAAPLLLAACGGPQTSQANNSQANISKESRPSDNAVGSNIELHLSLGDAARIMHERHEGMESIGKNTKAINRELSGASPNLATVRVGAHQIAALSKQAANWFPAGTGPEAGKTGAKPAIWQNPRDFALKLHNFQAAATAFETIASMTDAARIKAGFGDLTATCKACHDTYRAEMHH